MQEIKPLIKYEDFAKIDIRVAEILNVEFIEKSEKLLKLEILLGTEKRQILSGIKEWYKPEDLIGKKLLIVANLEPRKMMGLESQGMILAVDSTVQEPPVLLTFTDNVSSGDSVR